VPGARAWTLGIVLALLAVAPRAAAGADRSGDGAAKCPKWQDIRLQPYGQQDAGEPVRVRDLLAGAAPDMPTVLVFWGPGCDNCIDPNERRVLAELSSRFRGIASFVGVVPAWEERDREKVLASGVSMGFAHYLDADGSGVEGCLAKHFGVSGCPTFVILDGAGRKRAQVATALTGSGRMEAFAAVLGGLAWDHLTWDLDSRAFEKMADEMFTSMKATGVILPVSDDHLEVLVNGMSNHHIAVRAGMPGVTMVPLAPSRVPYDIVLKAPHFWPAHVRAVVQDGPPVLLEIRLDPIHSGQSPALARAEVDARHENENDSPAAPDPGETPEAAAEGADTSSDVTPPALATSSLLPAFQLSLASTQLNQEWAVSHRDLPSPPGVGHELSRTRIAGIILLALGGATLSAGTGLGVHVAEDTDVLDHVKLPAPTESRLGSTANAFVVAANSSFVVGGILSALGIALVAIR
jgi:hypothetical protein